MADSVFAHSVDRDLNPPDSNRHVAAGGMADAAGSLRSLADRLPDGRIRDLAGQGANALDGAAHYLRDTPAHEMLEDLRDSARAHPVPFIAGAIALGFVAGRLLRR